MDLPPTDEGDEPPHDYSKSLKWDSVLIFFSVCLPGDDTSMVSAEVGSGVIEGSTGGPKQTKYSLIYTRDSGRSCFIHRQWIWPYITNGGEPAFESLHHPDPCGPGGADHCRDSWRYCYQPQVQHKSGKERCVSHNRPPNVARTVICF